MIFKAWILKFTFKEIKIVLNIVIFFFWKRMRYYPDGDMYWNLLSD
jgi:hypothetical protein